MTRFTAYLSDSEMEGLRKLADTEGTSVNYFVRFGVRLILGKEVPPWFLEKLEEALHEKAR